MSVPAALNVPPIITLPLTVSRYRPLVEGEETLLDLTLFSQSHRYLPYVIHALDQGAAHGMGAQRGRLTLVQSINRLELTGRRSTSPMSR